MQGWDGNTFLYLSVDPSLLSLLVGLGLRNPRGLWIVSEEGPADLDATQHFVPSTALTAENNYRTTNVSKALSDTYVKWKCDALSHFRLHLAGRTAQHNNEIKYACFMPSARLMRVMTS